MKQTYGMVIGLLALVTLLIDPGSAHAYPAVRVPEPATVTLFASGAVLLGAIGLLRGRKK